MVGVTANFDLEAIDMGLEIYAMEVREAILIEFIMYE